SFLNHGSVEIRVFPIEPQRPTVLHGTAFSAPIELGEETCGILAAFEILRVKPGPVVVGDEAAMQVQMLIEPFCEVLKAQPVFEKSQPYLKHKLFVARAHELGVTKYILHRFLTHPLKGVCARACHETLKDNALRIGSGMPNKFIWHFVPPFRYHLGLKA